MLTAFDGYLREKSLVLKHVHMYVELKILRKAKKLEMF